MLVIIDIGNIHLAQAVGGVVTLHLRQHTDLQSPVAGNTQIIDHIRAKRELPGQWVPVTVQVIQEIVGAADLLQGSDQRCYQQATDPSVHFSVRYTGVVAFAEHVVEAGVSHRVDQPGHKIPGIRKDVAVVQGNGFADTRGQHIAKAIPDVSPFTHFRWCQVLLPKLQVNVPESRPVVPEHLEVLW